MKPFRDTQEVYQFAHRWAKGAFSAHTLSGPVYIPWGITGPQLYIDECSQSSLNSWRRWMDRTEGWKRFGSAPAVQI